MAELMAFMLLARLEVLEFKMVDLRVVSKIEMQSMLANLIVEILVFRLGLLVVESKQIKAFSFTNLATALLITKLRLSLVATVSK